MVIYPAKRYLTDNGYCSLVNVGVEEWSQIWGFLGELIVCEWINIGGTHADAPPYDAAKTPFTISVKTLKEALIQPKLKMAWMLQLHTWKQTVLHSEKISALTPCQLSSTWQVNNSYDAIGKYWIAFLANIILLKDRQETYIQRPYPIYPASISPNPSRRL